MPLSTSNRSQVADVNDGDNDDARNSAGTVSQSGSTTSSALQADDGKVAAFLARCGLKISAVAAVHEFAAARFPGYKAAPAPFQGYCSYTLLLLPLDRKGRRRDSGVEAGDGSDGGSGSGSASASATSGEDRNVRGGGSLLIQFRPRRHAIDVGICVDARGVFGDSVVPGVGDLGALSGLETTDAGARNGGELCAYVLERMGGVSLTEFRASSATLGADARACRRRVVADLAVVFANSWRGRRDRRDIVVKGKVGGSLRWRVEAMAEGLPREFRRVARRAAGELAELEDTLPWVVTHGDLVPDNILVHPAPCGEGDDGARRRRMERAGGLVGLIDWAEAEWLPFGMGMYGLEEVLGEDVTIPAAEEEEGGGGGGGEDHKQPGVAGGGTSATTTTRFEYYPEASSLRTLFWNEVGRVVGDEEVTRRARRAQVLGVLLWRGIAFDDGALGRVVDARRDWWDVQRLGVWLFGNGGLGEGGGGGGGGEETDGDGETKKGAWVRRVWRVIGGCFKAF
ncbi:Putative aminoglycoside phosphotransferase, protein kinase-like domain superfamily [Colletotrichum destructivum]|uniref:Aminoglycoside phosphotransferase, protein kinase-like domain superfamily n=1 Tax=Colletotrichum destructivum TaxID=34406 RepID=A0AAX4HYQ4_9PEZI|nr:Putative aminoglycoside phosphotransferase, protein kinase-like domain superfamily [Colletotrichum destructivum]